MCGLPQAGILAKKLLDGRLNAKGYQQSDICPSFGNMIGAQFASAYALTISVLSMWAGNTLNTS